MENDRKKTEQQAESEEATPTFDEVVRKMLNTPPKPKKSTGEKKGVHHRSTKRKPC